MKRFLVFSVLSIILVTAANSFAQDKFDPAARAKLIAPFIEEQTAAVVHVDFSRIKIDSLLKLVAQMVPEDEEHFSEAKQHAPQAIDSFLKAGGKDIYFVVQASITSKPKVIIPVNPQTDQRAFMENELCKDMPLKHIGDVLVASDSAPDNSASSDKTAPDQRPELAVAFEAAGDTAIQVLMLPPKYYRRVIEETMPELPKEIGGGPSSVVTNGCLWAALSVDFSPQLTARLVVQSQDAAAAVALNKKLGEVVQTVAQMPQVKAMIPKFAETTGIFIPKVEGNQLVLSLDAKQKEIGDLLNSVITPALREARGSAERMASINNLKQIGLAMHNYHDAHKHLPAAASYSPDGKPLLSWRVMILPMIEQGVLYDQFHFDEPWDSEHNKKLIDKMPPEYRSPKSKLKDYRSNYVVPVGPGTVFEGREGMSFKNITDGTSCTIMAVEVDDAHAVIWTKPDDLPYDPKEPSKGLGGLYKNCFIALFCDGYVRVIKLPCPDETLRAAFSAAAHDPRPDFD
jgi:hypothetical protein